MGGRAGAEGVACRLILSQGVTNEFLRWPLRVPEGLCGTQVLALLGLVLCPVERYIHAQCLARGRPNVHIPPTRLHFIAGLCSSQMTTVGRCEMSEWF